MELFEASANFESKIFQNNHSFYPTNEDMAPYMTSFSNTNSSVTYNFDYEESIYSTNTSNIVGHLYDYDTTTTYEDLSGISNETISSAGDDPLNDKDSYAAYERFMVESRHWVQRIMVPIVMCIGVVGNSVSMVVLTRRKMRSSTNNYLTALAISDLLYLVFVFSLSLQHHPDIKHPRHWFYWQYFRYGLWLTDASSNTSIWLTVTFTIERYIAVSHPIKGKVLCTISRAKKVIFVVFVLCWALTATTPHEWVVVTKLKPPTHEPYLTLDYSSLGQHPTYRHAYYWFTAVTFILLPLCLLAVFNFILIQAVRKSKHQRRKMTMVSERDHYSHQQEHKITVMLIAVVILALVCQMPTAVLLLYSTVYEPPPKTKTFAVMRGLGNIFNFLIALNAASNFILYCAFSDKYRKTFLITFVPCVYHQQPHVAHSFSAGAGTRRGASEGRPFVKAVSGRLSKTYSSPMPPTRASPCIGPGSYKENGIGALDARVTIQYNFGRGSRHNLTQRSNTQGNHAVANNNHNDRKILMPNDYAGKSTPAYTPNRNCGNGSRDAVINNSNISYVNNSITLNDDADLASPLAQNMERKHEAKIEGKVSNADSNTDQDTQLSEDVPQNDLTLENETKKMTKKKKNDKSYLTTVEVNDGMLTLENTMTNNSTGSAEDESSSLLDLKFIDEESCDTCQSPTSSNRQDDFEFADDTASRTHTLTRDILTSSTLVTISPPELKPKTSESFSKDLVFSSPD